jgi:hypothetical protein
VPVCSGRVQNDVAKGVKPCRIEKAYRKGLAEAA